MRSATRTMAAAIVVGATAAVALAAFSGTSGHDTLILLSLALAGGGAAAVVGALALRRFRGRPVGTQALVIALSSSLVTVSGVVAAAAAMFISRHDFQALLVVLVMSAAVSIGAALRLGADIGAGASHVSDVARGILNGDGPRRIPATTPPELADLAAQLEQVSEELASSNARERAIERSRRELILWVSHDLRSPLAAIRAMAEALDDRVAEDAETIGRYHHQIRNDAERLTALVDDLFELSNIHSGTRRREELAAPLAGVVAEAVAGAQARARLKGVTLVDDLGQLPSLDVPAHQWLRVIQNLLDNAIRHTPPGGQVAVRSVSDGEVASLLVVDECGGIPVDDLERVFDVSFRGDMARRRDEGGGGLGLPIAKGIVEAHAGSIDVANDAQGCRFTVRLPVSS